MEENKTKEFEKMFVSTYDSSSVVAPRKDREKKKRERKYRVLKKVVVERENQLC